MSERTVRVLAPGPLTTIQDRGRSGFAAWGVGRSGAADRGAADLANRIVANPADAAVFEITLGGFVARAESALTLALTGAPAPAEVDGVPVPFGAPLALGRGRELLLRTPAFGLRTYLAVRGGLAVAPVLGSRSSDLLARLGPAPLQAGDVVPIGPEPTSFPQVDLVAAPAWAAQTAVLSWRAGPHLDAVADDAHTALSGAIWTVSADSDRTAVRLTGLALRRRDDREWPPEGLVRGAIQLPPAGHPVVMLADHPVTGGYPAIGVLDERSCDRAAQLRPGDRLRIMRQADRVSARGGRPGPR